MKARFQKEKENAAQGTGEYREIVEEDFKEVTRKWVVVHFYHTEFFAWVVDKHMRLIAPSTAAASSSTATPRSARSS